MMPLNMLAHLTGQAEWLNECLNGSDKYADAFDGTGGYSLCDLFQLFNVD